MELRQRRLERPALQGSAQGSSIALKNIKVEVELGFDAAQAFAEAQRCLNCDVQTVFAPKLCIECDACVDICPMDCITFTANGDEPDLRDAAECAVAPTSTQDLYVSRRLKTGRVMAKDEDVCLHCGLCAERCPTGAWDMQKFLLETAQACDGTSAAAAARRAADARRHAASRGIGRVRMKLAPIERINDFVVKFANVNGSGSASANVLFAKAILRMGVPVAPRNIFPSNIQGLPTWYEVRVSEAGWRGRRGGVDLMVAMNPQTWDKDLAEIEPGGYLFYDSTKPLPAVEVPRRHHGRRHAAHRDLQPRVHRPAPAPAVQEHHLRRRALGAARHRARGDREADRRAVQGQGDAAQAQRAGAAHGPDYAPTSWTVPLGIRVERANAVGERIFIEGNSAAALGCVYGGATVAAWYPITPSSSLAEAFARHCKRFRVDPATGKARYAIVQAEDELASIGIVIGAGWNGARAFTCTSGPASR